MRRARIIPALLVPALLVLAALTAGCGYHVLDSGGAIPASARVIAVLPFTNSTRQPGLSQALSAAVAQELESRAHYRVQPELAGSDAAIHGDLRNVTINPITFDSTSARATAVEVVVHLQAWVTAEPSGKELFRNNDMVFHEQYEISPQEQSFFEEDSTAMMRLSQEVAQTLVADILEAF
ncbi:MAG: LPS assembly lipoprotein LptE [Terriglobales bacterium]